MFGARGNTKHVKCAHLDVFYMSGGERRLPNMKAMPILAWLSCLAEVGCMLLKYTKISEFIEKMKEKLSVPHTPSPFMFSLVSSLPDVVKMKGNVTRGGDPSPSHPK